MHCCDNSGIGTHIGHETHSIDVRWMSSCVYQDAAEVTAAAERKIR